jgi:hypothetical protein
MLAWKAPASASSEVLLHSCIVQVIRQNVRFLDLAPRRPTERGGTVGLSSVQFGAVRGDDVNPVMRECPLTA